MANPFLNKTDLMERDIETALLLEQATVHDIGRAVAYTDGKKIYINTEDNLFKILPAYDVRMLKWLLWHEKYHLELRHHNRFFKYIAELKEEDLMDEFHVTQEEVNIIMDILVHDSLSKLFPELIEVAQTNLAQFRDRNSLKYTFTTNTLEEMLDEYAKFKHHDTDDKDKDDTDDKDDKDDTDDKDPKRKKKPHKKGEDTKEDKEKPLDRPEDDPEMTDHEKEEHISTTPEPSEHDKTDWSKLDEIDSKEFITKEEADEIENTIAKIRKTKLRLATITETLNGLVTSTRRRTYSMPSTIQVGGGVILKGSTPGRTKLYLIFDASGSMSYDMDMFKEIITGAIPQALDVPCEWFAGRGAKIKPYKTESWSCDGYYKGKYKDFIGTSANSGFDDDGDRTIELCWLAEQLGYTPIGITDGGGKLSWSKDKLKQLKRTVIVCRNKRWLTLVKEVNPTLQTICTSED